jgi:hypothetical protein
MTQSEDEAESVASAHHTTPKKTVQISSEVICFNPISHISLTPNVRPSQLPLEFRTGVVDHRACRPTTATTLLWRPATVIVRGGTVCRRIFANRGGNDIVTRWDGQPAHGVSQKKRERKKKERWMISGETEGEEATHCRLLFDRAAERTSDRKRLTSSTMSFFMPSIESSSSKKKSNV